MPAYRPAACRCRAGPLRHNRVKASRANIYILRRAWLEARGDFPTREGRRATVTASCVPTRGVPVPPRRAGPRRQLTDGMVTGTVPPGLFFFLFFFRHPPGQGGRPGGFVYPGLTTPAAVCLYWARHPAVHDGLFILGPSPSSVAPAAQPKTETTTRGGQPKHPKRTTNNCKITKLNKDEFTLDKCNNKECYFSHTKFDEYIKELKRERREEKFEFDRRARKCDMLCTPIMWGFCWPILIPLNISYCTVKETQKGGAGSQPTQTLKLKWLSNLRRARKGAAPGPSGLTAEVARVLLDDEGASDLFVRVTQLVAQAAVPRDAARALGLGRMVALQKPNGRVRGIVIGDFTRRLVAR